MKVQFTDENKTRAIITKRVWWAPWRKVYAEVKECSHNDLYVDCTQENCPAKRHPSWVFRLSNLYLNGDQIRKIAHSKVNLEPLWKSVPNLPRAKVVPGVL